ncbi:MAG: T9SS type A sorting domain-containing protein, partial [Bacteroidota bacterium]
SNQTGWDRVNGCFTASGGESYITVGCFEPMANLTSQVTGNSGAYAYYFIDDVFVAPLSVDAGSDALISCNTSTTLTANSSCFQEQISTGTFTFTWAPSTGLSSTSGQTVTASPGSTTTYTVTMTTPDGHLVTDDVTVTVDPPCFNVTASSNATINCLTDEVDLDATIVGGTAPFTFVWSSNPAGFSSSIQNPIDHPATPGLIVYTVTVTDVNAQTSSSTISVYVINATSTECCIPQNFNPATGDLDYSNTSVSSLGIASITTTHTILINGIFTVDDDFSFIGCSDIQLGPNAQIVFQGANHTLTIRASVLHACSDMWQGIYANTGDNLKVEDSFIDDGIEAITGTGLPKMYIHGNFFNDNRIALHLRLGDFSNTQVFANTFSCYTVLKNPYSTQYTEQQIFAEDATNVTIGDAFYGTNFIYDGRWGIYALRSDITIDNGEFDVINNPNARWAVYAYGLNATVWTYHLNVGINASNTFGHYQFGITANKAYQSIISSNTFTEVAEPIRTLYCPGQIITITRNTLDHFKTGVYCYEIDHSALTINGNNFNSGIGLTYDPSHYGYKAINVENVNPSIVVHNIENNKVWNVQYGIHMRNIQNGFIDQNNEIHFLLPEADIQYHRPMHGIWLENCLRIQVLNNLIDWNNTPRLSDRDVLRGINVTTSVKCIMKENHLINMGVGFRFSGDCSLVDLYCNTMETCWHGVYKDGAGINTVVTTQGSLGSHESWNNKWIDIPQGVITNRIEGTPPTPLTIWIYNSLGQSPFVPIPYNPFYYTLQPVTTSNGCLAPAPMADGDREKAFGATVRDTIINDPDSLYFKYLSKKAYYDAVSTDNTLLSLSASTDPLYQDKYEELDESNIGKFNEINVDLINKENTAALAKLTSLQEENTIESNLKIMQTVIALEYTVDMDADSDTLVVVRNIAYQHPFYGGQAVFMARAMLHLDVEDELPQMRKAGHNQGSEVPKTAGSLYPNPTSNEATFHLDHLKSDNVNILVYDIFGKKVEQLIMAGNDLSFSTRNLNAGVYIMKIIVNGTENEMHRLTILR